MIDYHKELLTALSSVDIPVYYEMVLHSGLNVPCISYMEINDYVTNDGDTIEYSRKACQIKIWANDIATIQHYAVKIDNNLRLIGFKRTQSGELYDNSSSMIQKVLTYECLALEKFN